MKPSTVVDELLDDRTYHIEFNGHLTNHAKHAVIALAGLGASAERIQTYYEGYARLTPYGYGLDHPRPSTHTITEDNWQQFLGRRTNFAGYCAFFDRREQELGLDEVLRQYGPVLLPGWVGSFTHAAIHLGWALDAGSRWMAVEGLAYLAFSYVSCRPERLRPSTARDESPIDSLLRAAAAWDGDRDGFRRWVEHTTTDTTSAAAAGIHPELARSGLQYRIARLLTEGHSSFYDSPTWIDELDVRTCWDRLYYLVTLLYLTKPGDFILLHLITSLYGIEKIADRLPEDQQRDVVRCYWTGLFPILLSEADVPRQAEIAQLHARYQGRLDGPHPAGETWDELVARAIDEDEEHNPKMVFVLRQVWRMTNGHSIYRAAASEFTKTPALPATFDEPPAEEDES